MKERFSKHEPILENIAKKSIEDEKDGRQFIELLADIYDMAYKKCVEDHKAELEKRGIKMIIKSQDTSSNDG